MKDAGVKYIHILFYIDSMLKQCLEYLSKWTVKVYFICFFTLFHVTSGTHAEGWVATSSVLLENADLDLLSDMVLMYLDPFLTSSCAVSPYSGLFCTSFPPYVPLVISLDLFFPLQTMVILNLFESYMVYLYLVFLSLQWKLNFFLNFFRAWIANLLANLDHTEQRNHPGTHIKYIVNTFNVYK